MNAMQYNENTNIIWVTTTRFELTNWPNDGAVFREIISVALFGVCIFHFRSKDSFNIRMWHAK